MIAGRPDDAADRAHWDAVEEATELLHEERFTEALIALRGVLQRDPTNGYAFHYLGVALFESGELDASRDAYRACLRLMPRHLGARVALVHVLRALGDFKAALQEGMTAVAQAEDDPDVLHAMGLVYVARGETSAAHRYLTAYLATNPEFEVATEVQGILASLDVRRS